MKIVVRKQWVAGFYRTLGSEHLWALVAKTPYVWSAALTGHDFLNAQQSDLPLRRFTHSDIQILVSF